MASLVFFSFKNERKMEELIYETIKYIDDISRLFYMQRNDEANSELEKLIEKLALIIELIQGIGDNECKDFATYLTNVLSRALSAMEDKDTILLADIRDSLILLLGD